jgi:hypothetical protein
VYKRLSALQFDGTTATAQGSTRCVAGAQTQPVVVQHWLFMFFFISYYCFDKNTCKTLQQK